MNGRRGAHLLVSPAKKGTRSRERTQPDFTPGVPGGELEKEREKKERKIGERWGRWVEFQRAASAAWWLVSRAKLT